MIFVKICSDFLEVDLGVFLSLILVILALEGYFWKSEGNWKGNEGGF